MFFAFSKNVFGAYWGLQTSTAAREHAARAGSPALASQDRISGFPCNLGSGLQPRLLRAFLGRAPVQLGPPLERLEKGYHFFSVVYFSRGTLPQKRVKGQLLLGDLAKAFDCIWALRLACLQGPEELVPVVHWRAGGLALEGA